jgi:CelD/BcsL family acetyltransferase involved in cellulose biosynthesis
MSPDAAVARLAEPGQARPILRVETLTRFTDAENLIPQWRQLEARQGRAVLFQSAAWCLYVWRTRLAVSGEKAPEPRVIVVRQADDVIAIWPLAVQGGLAGRIAQDLTEPFGQYSDILLAPEADANAVREAVFAELTRWRIDALVLRRVREDAALAPWLAACGARLGADEGAPQIAIERLGGVEAWRRSLNAKTRKNLRNYRNRLAREGRIVHSVIDDPAERSDVVARCFDGRAGWLQSSGLTSSAFADPAFEAVVAGLASGVRGGPRVVALRLALERDDTDGPANTDLSLHWGVEHDGRYYAYMAARNPAFDGFSPGRLHLEDVIASMAARGNGTIDLQVPAVPYKTSVATDVIAVAAWALPFTWRGRVVVQGWYNSVRPRLKAALLRLPPGIRRVVLG